MPCNGTGNGTPWIVKEGGGKGDMKLGGECQEETGRNQRNRGKWI